MKFKKIMKEIWRTICYPLMYMGMQFVVGIIGAILISAAVMVSETIKGLLTTEGIAEKAMNVCTENVILLTLISNVITLFLMWIILRREWKSIKILKTVNAPVISLVACVLAGLPLSVFIGGSINLSGLLNIFPDYEQSMSNVLGNNLFLEILCIGLIAPFIEEMIFRGTILRRFKNFGINMFLAIFVSSLLFGLMHISPVQVIYTFVLGIVFGAIYWRHDSIWPVTILHVAFNMVSIIMSNLPNGGDAETAAESPTSSMIIIILIAFLVSAGLLMLIMKKKKQIKSEEILL